MTTARIPCGNRAFRVRCDHCVCFPGRSDDPAPTVRLIFAPVRSKAALQSVSNAGRWGTLLVRPSGAVLEEAVTRDRTTVTVIPARGDGRGEPVVRPASTWISDRPSGTHGQPAHLLPPKDLP